MSPPTIRETRESVSPHTPNVKHGRASLRKTREGLSSHTTLQVDRIFRQLEMNSFLTHFTTLQSWHTRYIEASELPHPLPKMSCKKICPIAQLH